MTERLAPPAIASGARGRGVRVALVDTGVNFKHPHIARAGTSVVVARSASVLEEAPDLLGDQVGHGTACAALLFYLAPEVELISVRVTDARPSTDAERLAQGIEVAGARGAELIAVPLGTPRASPALAGAVERASSGGALVVAAAPGPEVYPAAFPGVLGVSHRDGVDVVFEAGTWWAEGRARPVPGQDRNFYGPSLAVARLAGALARFREVSGLSKAALLPGFQKALSVL